MRVLVAVVVVLVAVFGIVTWRQKSANVGAPGTAGAPPPLGAPDARTPVVEGAPPAEGPPSSHDRGGDSGVDWVVPRAWINQIGSGMRLATYIVPGSEPKNDAECAVFHFPPGQGGAVDANLDRWSEEFEKIDRQDSRRREINGLKLATLEVRGTFAGHTMRSEDATGPRPSWGLLGAIVEGPNGNVIFKLTGPEATVTGARPAFEELLSSLHTH